MQTKDKEQLYEPILLHFGENQVPKEVQKEAWSACDALVRKFKECSKNRTFSISWACQEQLQDMTQCIYQYETDENNIRRARWKVAKEHPAAVRGYRKVNAGASHSSEKS